MVEFGKQHPNMKQLDNSAIKEMNLDVTGSLHIEPDNLVLDASQSISVSWPKPKSRLHLIPGFCWELEKPRPNAWWRLWHWVFFGIKWERIDENG